MIELTDMGYPQQLISTQDLNNTITHNIDLMQDKYSKKHNEILNKITSLQDLLNRPDNWWLNKAELTQANLDLEQFIDNIELNFGENASIYKIINSQDTIESYQKNIATAISSYTLDISTWQEILSMDTLQQ